MASRALNYLIGIDANGTPAIGELNKVERAVEGVDDEVENLADPGKLDGLKDGLSGIGDQLGPLKGAAGFAGLATAILGVSNQVADIANETVAVGTALDTDIDTAGRLRAAFADVGLDAAGVVGLALSISDQLQGNVDLADKLGVNLQTVADNPIEAVRAGIDNWDLLTPTERAQLFGEEGVLAISKMIDEGNTLTEILEGVEDTRVLTDEQVANAEKFTEATAELKGAWEGIVISLSDSFIPLLAESGQLVADLVNGLNSFEIGGKNKLSIFSSWPEVFRFSAEQLDNVIDGVKGVDDAGEEAGQSLFEAGNIAEGEWSKAGDAVAGVKRELDGIPDNKTITVTANTIPIEESLRRIGSSFGPQTINRNITVNLSRSAGIREVNRAIVDWNHANG